MNKVKNRQNLSGYTRILHLGTLALMLIFALPSAALAAVTSNGNFYIDYTDYVSSDNKIVINRVYNSITHSTHLFGKGWGSVFETRLGVVGDGTVVLHSNGTGSREVFKSVTTTPAATEKAVTMILAAIAKEHEHIVGHNGETAEEMRQWLIGNDKDRESLWVTYESRGLLPTADIPIGTRLYSNGNFGAHYLERTKAGYKVSSWLASDTFDSQGRLAYHEDTPSNSSGKDKLKLYWGEKNTLLAYSDDKGEQMMFIRRNDGGQITGIIDHEGKAVARYKYDDDKLIHSRDVDNHIYIYHYDKNDHMIEVQYTDGSKFVITYDADGRALNNKRIKSGNK